MGIDRTCMRHARFVLAVLAGLLSTLALGTAASAHATLVRTDPSSGGVVASLPGQITLTFSEGVRPIVERIRVLGPDRSRVDTGAAAAGTNVTIKLRNDASRGTYLVTFRVISADSHPIAGSYTFAVGSPSANAPSASDAAEDRADPVVATALGTARFLGYTGLVLLFGPLLFLARLWPKRLSRRLPARLLSAGLITLAFSTLAEMYLQAPYTAGTSLFGVSSTALRDALSGTFGSTHVVRLAVILAIALIVRPFVQPAGPTNIDLGVMAFLGVIGVGTWPLSGHPASSPVPAVSMVADAVHLAAMATWLGGLVILGVVMLLRANGRELAAILPVWSSWALLAVIALVMTGIAQAIIEVVTVSALFDTAYGLLVLGKAALLLGAVGVAFFSRRLVGRISAGEAAAAKPSARLLRRTVIAELAVTGVVLALAAALVQTPPARTADSSVQQPFTTTLTSNLFQVRIELFPMRVGANTLHLYAFNPQGSGPQTVLQWSVTATPADGSVEALTVPILPLAEDHATSEPTFPTAGDWDLKLTLRTTDVDQASVTQRVSIQDE
jgi:copper transport protein